VRFSVRFHDTPTVDDFCRLLNAFDAAWPGIALVDTVRGYVVTLATPDVEADPPA
jgi:hypothetical protein